MQHPVGDHALLADGRTAALVDPDGNVAWLPWPRIDSSPCLLSLLDDVAGGTFSLAPADPAATVVERGYVARSLVLRTVWRCDGEYLTVHDGLAWDGEPRLVRTVHASAGVEVVARVALAPEAATLPAQPSARGAVLEVRGGGLAVTVHAPSPWEVDAGGGATCRFRAGPVPAALVLCDAGAAPLPSLEATLAHFGATVPGDAGIRVSAAAEEILGEAETARLVQLSAAVLTGLRQRGGGIVAAPTTSIPQWPGSARTWDYRYSWLRDTALAGLAMLRGGLVDDATALGEFLGAATASMPPAVLLRVDGTAPPAERTLDHLRGYRGARPVRIGNAASDQPQLDVAGEVLELAAALAAHDALPGPLRTGAARVATWTAEHWREPDHGIWEIRGEPRHYTHSRVMAWAGLTGAAGLAERGVVEGDAGVWRRAATAIRATVLGGAGPLLLADDGGGPDAALAQAVLTGFLDPDDPRAAATLGAIVTGLDRGGLVERHDPAQDPSPDPCGPFLFPTFWVAEALRRSGAGGARQLGAAVSARGALDLFGEVADPTDLTPLGNYPQVQSHAAFILAATEAPLAGPG